MFSPRKKRRRDAEAPTLTEMQCNERRSDDDVPESEERYTHYKRPIAVNNSLDMGALLYSLDHLVLSMSVESAVGVREIPTTPESQRTPVVSRVDSVEAFSAELSHPQDQSVNPDSRREDETARSDAVTGGGGSFGAFFRDEDTDRGDKVIRSSGDEPMDVQTARV